MEVHQYTNKKFCEHISMFYCKFESYHMLKLLGIIQRHIYPHKDLNYIAR